LGEHLVPIVAGGYDTRGTEPSTHPDLPAEQAYLDRAYECLEDMRHQAARGARIVMAGDPFAEEAIYQMFLSRLADLSEETALCFGRIDRVDGDLYDIGRRHVHDENLDPVVIDWRAPVAEAFYQRAGTTPGSWSAGGASTSNIGLRRGQPGSTTYPEQALHSTRGGRSE